MKFIDVRISALSDADLKDVIISLRKIQYCGEIGSNSLLPIQIDGDGSGIIKFEIHKNEIPNPNLKNFKDFVELNSDEMDRVLNGEYFKTHWIGE
jgi:hypothetical protein